MSGSPPTRFSIKLTPGARRTTLTEQSDGTWRATVTAPATADRANRAMLALLAEHWGIPKSRLTIERGRRSRQKLVAVLTRPRRPRHNQAK